MNCFYHGAAVNVARAQRWRPWTS